MSVPEVDQFDHVDVALEPTREAAKSFAESVMLEEQKRSYAGEPGGY